MRSEGIPSLLSNAKSDVKGDEGESGFFGEVDIYTTQHVAWLITLYRPPRSLETQAKRRTDERIGCFVYCRQLNDPC